MKESVIPAEPLFADRHIGPSEKDIQEMLSLLGYRTLDDFIGKVVPTSIRLSGDLKLGRFQNAMSERAALLRLQEIASKNEIWRSFIGMGYFETVTPPAIQRNILENPGWYTQYTPYQPEISQGRLEALLNFQTMVSDLTGFPVANASLLDEATAAAEAMLVCFNIAQKEGDRRSFFVSSDSYPQTIALIKTRAKPFGINVVVGDIDASSEVEDLFGVFLQYPSASGSVVDYSSYMDGLHKTGVMAVVAADILSLCILKSPAEMGADIAVGSTQRFGIAPGYGGPHAAYFACKDEYKRQMPGRLIGVSKDADGKTGLRLALQTREQHIRREKATSNICTAQVLLAVMASMYAVYHGPKGLRTIAERVHVLSKTLAEALREAGVNQLNENFFATLCVKVDKAGRDAVLKRAEERHINLCVTDPEYISVSLDEATTEEELLALVEIFSGKQAEKSISEYASKAKDGIPDTLLRKSHYLMHPVFNSYHSETAFLRYVKHLESKDLSLCASMIPLGSCTMKLNATSEMLAISWPQFSKLHPFAPREQAKGYEELFMELEQSLCEITGFSAASLQPNSGAQGEYTGLLTIRAWHEHRGEGSRDICLIPKSAHGTNPASSAMAGFKVVSVECDSEGNIDVADLRNKAKEAGKKLAALMVTYPSTHGVFEESVKEFSEIIHAEGGQLYLDGANMNALVGLVRASDLGADVCHLNLHKTFAIPHGGGGPGVGPICVAAHLEPFLPNHPVVSLGHEGGAGPVCAAPWGSASVLPISWAYIAMMGASGLKRATEVAILNANYIAKRLEGVFPVLYKGKNALVAHECILDLHNIKNSAGVDVDDVAKRLMDYSIHAPTVSWPVPGTIMVEPTESENKFELDRFCDAMLAIRKEADKIEKGVSDPKDNPLKNAPHTLEVLLSDDWRRPYSREEAAYPVASLRSGKFWPSVGRIDASYGDRNLVCVCPRVDD